MILRIAFTLFLAAVGSTAGAQTIYKSIMPDGRIIYGNSPAKGAATVESIQPVLPPAGEAGTSAPAPETASAARPERTVDTREAQWREVEAELRAAQAALDKAKANAEAGVAPLPGEMVGNADNRFVRPREEYLARQQQLADKVKEAQARLDAAFAARNALR